MKKINVMSFSHVIQSFVLVIQPEYQRKSAVGRLESTSSFPSKKIKQTKNKNKNKNKNKEHLNIRNIKKNVLLTIIIM